jgi:DNA-directed RNA polymerase specialized sigma24 family protein
MKFNSNKERKAYWDIINEKYCTVEIKKAFDTLKPDAQKILHLRYKESHTFQQISIIMKLSMTVIRNHHNRGIYLLYRHFNPRSSENISGYSQSVS